MSAQISVSVTKAHITSATASHGDLQIAAGYRELEEHATANAVRYRAQAEKFAKQGQGELAHVCRSLAEEATQRSEAYAANAYFFETSTPE